MNGGITSTGRDILGAWIPDSIMTSHQGRVPAPMQVQETEAVSVGCRWSSLFWQLEFGEEKIYTYLYIYIYTRKTWNKAWFLRSLSHVLVTFPGTLWPYEIIPSTAVRPPGDSVLHATRQQSLQLDDFEMAIKIVKRWYQTWLLQHEAVNQVVFLQFQINPNHEFHMFSKGSKYVSIYVWIYVSTSHVINDQWRHETSLCFFYHPIQFDSPLRFVDAGTLHQMITREARRFEKKGLLLKGERIVILKGM